MGILVKKKQAGGALFDIGSPNMGENDFKGFIESTRGSRGRSSGGGSSYGSKRRTGKTKDEKEFDALTGALNSDIEYYKAQKRKIKEDMETLVKEGGEEATSSPEYKNLISEYHKLETEWLPSMKRMAQLYSTTKTAFGNAHAADSPAIVGNEAIVFDNKNKKYDVVQVDNLVREAPNYKLLNGADVLTLRMNNSQFSGFTELGNAAMTFLNTAYGDESFNDYVKGRVKQAGYYKDNGQYVNTSGDVLDLSGKIEKTGDPKKDKKVKTNVYNLNMLMNDILDNSGSNATNYLYGVSVRNLYNKSRHNNDAFVEASDEDLQKLMSQNLINTLHNNIATALVVDTGGKSDGTGSEDNGLNMLGGDKALSKINRNVFAVANATLGKKREPIEVAGAKRNDKIYSNMYSVPTAEVGRGKTGKTVLDAGFDLVEKASDYDANEYDKIGGDDSFKRRTVDNNTIIKSILGNNGQLTTADGTPITQLTTDENVQYITTAPGTDMYLMLAPVETVNGKKRVNFNSSEKKKIDKAIQEAYDEMDRKGISKTDITLGGNESLRKELAKIATQKLKDAGVKGNLTIQVVAAFDVLFEVARNKRDYKYMKTPSEEEADFLDKVNSGVFTDRVRKATVFAPLSEGFYSNMFASNAFGADFDSEYSVNDWLGMIKSVNWSPYDVNAQAKAEKEQRERETAEKKQHGGKLIGDEEAFNLLFG